MAHTGQTTGAVEVDSDDSFTDYAESLASDTTSLTSSIYNHVYENGRRYHHYQEGKYVMPNDEEEQDRLDIHAHIFNLMGEGNLTFTPVENPQRVLDVGTGTGVWALQAAEVWPSAEVIGTDLSPIQPAWTYPNCRFEIDDCELDWTFPANHFDLIHSRAMLQAIRDWPKYIGQIFRHTKPGGYVQLTEIRGQIDCDDDTVKPDSNLRVYWSHWRAAIEKAGMTHWEYTDLERMLREAGFVDVMTYHRKQFMSTWPKDPKLKEIGRFQRLNNESIFTAYGVALFTRYLGMTPEDAYRLCDACKQDANNPKNHSYCAVWFIIARKPEPDEM